MFSATFFSRGYTAACHVWVCHRSALDLLIDSCLGCHLPDLIVGPACLTCREKCRKCDRARPACNRCVAKGLDCGGYPEQFRFCGIASRGKWKGAQLPAGERSARASSSRVARRQTRNSPTTELVTANTPKSPESTHATPTLVKPTESPQGPSDEILRILSLAETETLLSHCRQACFLRNAPDGMDNVAAQMIALFVRTKYPKLEMTWIIPTDRISFHWHGSKSD